MDQHSYKFTDLNFNHTIDPVPNPDKFPMHTHSHCELFFFLSGSGVFHIEGSEYPLSPGDVVLMRPAEAHYIEIDPSEPYERVSIHFDGNIFHELDTEKTLMRPYFERKAGKRNVYANALFENRQHLNCLHSMIPACPGKRLNIIANLILILQQIGILYDREQSESMEPDTIEYRIIRYINKNLHRDLTLQELCDRYFISKAQLCRRFKKATGTTIAKYITVKRLVTSRHMITQGQRPTEVYTQLGFRDYSTFYRAYTKHFGHSPKQEVPFNLSELTDESMFHIL